MPDHFKRELLLSLSIIFGGVLILGAALYFLSQDLSFQAEKIATDRILINQRAAAIDALARLKRDTSAANVYKEALGRLLVSQDQLLDFPRWLDGLALVRQVGMNFSFRGSQVASQGALPGYVNFSLDLGGGLSNLLDFLKDVEFKSPRFLVQIDNFDLTKGESSYRILANGRVFFK